jgi:drug/metabolite transporter (DMT)-like permease
MNASPVAASTPARLTPLIIACLAATWVIWGSTYLAIKWALISFPPYWQMGTRFLVAGAGLMLFMRVRGAAWPSAHQWRNAAIIGALMLGGGMGGTALGEATVSSGMIVAFIAVTPALIALFNVCCSPGAAASAPRTPDCWRSRRQLCAGHSAVC